MPALASTGLLQCAHSVYGGLPNGFYSLDTMLCESVFRALLGEARAQGAAGFVKGTLGGGVDGGLHLGWRAGRCARGVGRGCWYGCRCRSCRGHRGDHCVFELHHRLGEAFQQGAAALAGQCEGEHRAA